MSKHDSPSKHDLLSLDQTHRVRDTCMCLHVQRAARRIARRFDDALRPHGLTSGQFSLLVALNRPEPPPMGAVAALLAMDRTTLTANLKPLERRRLVTVAVGRKDRRNRTLALTAAGRRLLAQAFASWTGTQATLEPLVRSAGRFRADLAALSK